MTIVTTSGIPEIEKILDRLDPRDRQNAERRAVRAAAKPFQAALKRSAAAAQVPRSFQKVPAARVSTRGGASGREVSATVRPKSPLFNIFEPGAGAHEIAPHAKALSGPAGSSTWDGEGRKRPDAFFSMNAVHHPGMASRDIVGPAFAAGQAAAMTAFEEAIFATSPGGSTP